jgi:hypothetical protein
MNVPDRIASRFKSRPEATCYHKRPTEDNRPAEAPFNIVRLILIPDVRVTDGLSEFAKRFGGAQVVYFVLGIGYLSIHCSRTLNGFHLIGLRLPP